MNIPEGWPTEEMMYAAQGVKLTTKHPNIVYLREVIRTALAAAPTPETTCLFPLIDAQFETVEKGITGTTLAPVKRVEMRDDGSYTVIIDHWPAPIPAKELIDVPGYLPINGKATVWHEGTESYYEAVITKRVTMEEICAIDNHLYGSPDPNLRAALNKGKA